jgi:hypothetical protein
MVQDAAQPTYDSGDSSIEKARLRWRITKAFQKKTKTVDRIACYIEPSASRPRGLPAPWARASAS